MPSNFRKIKVELGGALGSSSIYQEQSRNISGVGVIAKLREHQTPFRDLRDRLQKNFYQPVF